MLIVAGATGLVAFTGVATYPADALALPLAAILGWYACRLLNVFEVRNTLRAFDSEIRSVYWQRNQLAGVLAAHYQAVVAHADPELPDIPVLYVHTPHGQMTWHIHPDDLEHVQGLSHAPMVTPDDPRARWDGHTPAEKDRRLRALTQ